MPRRTSSAPKLFVTPRTSSAGAPQAGDSGSAGWAAALICDLERAMSRSNWTFSAIAKMITTPTQMKNSLVLTPISVRPSSRMPIRIAPMKAPITVPRPPVSAVPPITQAPTAYRM